MMMFSRREFLTAAATGVAICSADILSADCPEHREDACEVDDVRSEMIVIPAGKFLMGTTEEQARKLTKQFGYHISWLSGEVPQREMELPAYAIDKYPVTNAQYAEFCKATGHAQPFHWRDGKPPQRLLDHPVFGVNHADATAYAKWAGKRLPTEAEWEKSARGTDGRMFPWGDEFDPDACCWNRDKSGEGPRIVPVTAMPQGASPYGVRHTVGNVAEWCADSPGPGAAYIKGGCWHTAEIINLRPAARNMSGFANNPLMFYGFRCAKTP